MHICRRTPRTSPGLAPRGQWAVQSLHWWHSQMSGLRDDLFEPPLGLKHLLAGKGLVVGGEVADHRTGVALVTLLDGVPPGGDDPLDELQVRFNESFACHGSLPPINP